MSGTADADMLEVLLSHQRDLQLLFEGSDPGDFADEQKIAYIKDMILAATDELHEALQEVGWKPWASERFINRDAFVGELIDAQHFLFNLFLAAGVTPDELFDRYLKKAKINVRRQEDGYDGVSDKCPSCRRSFDDVGISTSFGDASQFCGGCGEPLSDA